MVEMKATENIAEKVLTKWAAAMILSSRRKEQSNIASITESSAPLQIWARSKFSTRMSVLSR